MLGAPFYLMERRRGVILRKDLPPSSRRSRDDPRAICELLVDALVELHAVDYRAAGLGDLGKPAGYVERQVTRLDRALRRLADRRHPGDDRGRARGSPRTCPPTAHRR